jgi:hypothetical protein
MEGKGTRWPRLAQLCQAQQAKALNVRKGPYAVITRGAGIVPNARRVTPPA